LSRLSIKKFGNRKKYEKPGLLDKKVFLDFKKPFDLTLEYISTYDKKFFAKKDFKNSSFSSENASNPMWSQLLNVVRSYFEGSIP